MNKDRRNNKAASSVRSKWLDIVLYVCFFGKMTLEAQSISVNGNITMNISAGSAISQPTPVIDANTLLTYNIGVVFATKK